MFPSLLLCLLWVCQAVIDVPIPQPQSAPGINPLNADGFCKELWSLYWYPLHPELPEDNILNILHFLRAVEGSWIGVEGYNEKLFTAVATWDQFNKIVCIDTRTDDELARLNADRLLVKELTMNAFSEPKNGGAETIDLTVLQGEVRWTRHYWYIRCQSMHYWQREKAYTIIGNKPIYKGKCAETPDEKHNVRTLGTACVQTMTTSVTETIKGWLHLSKKPQDVEAPKIIAGGLELMELKSSEPLTQNLAIKFGNKQGESSVVAQSSGKGKRWNLCLKMPLKYDAEIHIVRDPDL